MDHVESGPGLKPTKSRPDIAPNMWGSPKIRGTSLVLGGLYWGSPTWANYHIPSPSRCALHVEARR